MRRAALLSLVLVARTSLAAIYESPISAEDEDDLVAAQERGELSPESAARLIELINDGVNLNTASRDDLYELPGMSWRDVDAIIEYRKLKGRIEDPAELVSAEAITSDTLLQIAPFIIIEPKDEVLPVGGKMKLASSLSNGDLKQHSFVDPATQTCTNGKCTGDTFLDPMTGKPRADIAPPVYFGGNFKGPWNLRAGIELATTRFRPSTPAYDSTRDTLVVTGPTYSVHLPKLYGQWKAGSRQITVGSFRVGFGERLTLDNTRRTRPNGFDVTSSVMAPFSELTSSPCKYSTGELSDSPCPTSTTVTDTATGLPVSVPGVPKATKDYTWTEGFRGIAGSVEDIELGDGGPKLSLFGFGSLQSRSLYQYQLFDKRNCPDPHYADPNQPNYACGAPTIYSVNRADPLAPSAQLSRATIPSAFHELAFGAHARLQPTPRFYFGATGYFATNIFPVSQMQLDLQEWSRFPWNGPYGAVGIDGKVTLGPLDFFGEFTRTFNGIPREGGGFGGIVRAVFNPKRHQVELSLRYYDKNFSNPHARPVASPDTFDGQRARNEAGAELDYVGKLPADFFLRANVNFWTNPFADNDSRKWVAFDDTTNQPVLGPGTVVAAGTTNLAGRVRLDFRGFDVIQGGVWFDYKNKDLANSRRGTCYSYAINSDDPTASSDEIDYEDPPVDADGNPLPCQGESYRVSAGVRFAPLRQALVLTAQAQNMWIDSPTYGPSSDFPNGTFRIDRKASLDARSTLLDKRLMLHARATWNFIGVYHPTGEHADLFTAFVQVSGRPWAIFRPALRYDLRVYTDSRPKTAALDPNPQHSFRLVIESKF